MLSPFRRFWDAQDELNRLVTETFRNMPRDPDAAASGWTPAADVLAREGDMIIRAELPGVRREDIDVSLRNGVLTISGERKEEEEHKSGGHLVRERRYGSFLRSMALPEGVDEEKITATFKDGMLEVIVKGASAQVEEGPRRIEIQG